MKFLNLKLGNCFFLRFLISDSKVKYSEPVSTAELNYTYIQIIIFDQNLIFFLFEKPHQYEYLMVYAFHSFHRHNKSKTNTVKIRNYVIFYKTSIRPIDKDRDQNVEEY